MEEAKFIRNKVVTVEQQDDETLLVRGLLADDIYGLEMKITVRIPDLEITAVEGQWNRWTTCECHRALAELQGALGETVLDPHFSEKITKGVGRSACRHFANLLLECCYSAKAAMRVLKRAPAAEAGRPGKGASRTATPQHGLTTKAESSRRSPGISKGGTIIDLHVHTHPASPCSSARLEELIQAAKHIGLDGICLTDHHHRWDTDLTARLRAEHGYLILAGNEITTDQGDILVFGLDMDIPGVIPIRELKELASAAGAFLIAAHPFRGFLTFGVGQLGLTPAKAMQRPLFRHVDAVEILNGKVTEKENAFSARVAEELGLPVTGGSDAHEVREVGIYATRFEAPIQNEEDLLAALKSGRYEPLAFHRNGR